MSWFFTRNILLWTNDINFWSCQTGINGGDAEYKSLPAGPSNNSDENDKEPEVSVIVLFSKKYNPLKRMVKAKSIKIFQVTILENVYWKELGLLVFVWVAFLGLQISKVILLYYFARRAISIDCKKNVKLTGI